MDEVSLKFISLPVVVFAPSNFNVNVSVKFIPPPENSVAVAVPTTYKAVDGDAVPIPKRALT